MSNSSGPHPRKMKKLEEDVAEEESEEMDESIRQALTDIDDPQVESLKHCTSRSVLRQAWPTAQLERLRMSRIEKRSH